MQEAALFAGMLVLLVAGLLLGSMAARWWALLLPLAGWPLFYLGLERAWWGDGLGDGWQYAAGALTAVGLATTAAAVTAARARR